MKRCLLFSILLVAVAIMFCVPSYAAESVTIEGEDLFNDTAEKMMSGRFSLSPINLINMILYNAVDEIKREGHFVLTLIIIAITASATTVLSNSFGEKSSGEAAFFAVFALMSGLALKCFSIALEYTSQVTALMCNFITKLSPLIIVTLAACGKAASAAAFEPVLSGAVYVVSLFVEKLLMPLSVFGAMLSVSSNISESVRLSGFSKMVNSVSKWFMAAIITLFTGVNAIYGMSAPALDAMSAKAAKFAIGSLVPVVGGFLSDTLETVITGARMMKNVAGSAGVIALVAICVVPVLKIGIIVFLLKASAAICEPITDKRISLMLVQISSSVTTLFAVTIMMAVLFIINIAMIVSFT